MILIVDQSGNLINLNCMSKIAIGYNQTYWQLRLYRDAMAGLANDYYILWEDADKSVLEDKLEALISYINIHSKNARLLVKMAYMSMSNRIMDS